MLWLVSLRVEDTGSILGSKTPVIPAQNKSVKWLLWNVTFQRLETMPLETKSKKKTKEKSPKAQEQLGEVL